MILHSLAEEGEIYKYWMHQLGSFDFSTTVRNNLLTDYSVNSNGLAHKSLP